MNEEYVMQAAHMMRQAADDMQLSAIRIETAANSIVLLLGDGHGGNGLRLISLLESQAQNRLPKVEQ